MTFHHVFKKEGVSYAFKWGGSKTVFIKAGLGSDKPEENEKYLNLAKTLYNDLGFSVILASNPNDGKSHKELDGHIIDRIISEMELDPCQLYFFGNSNGCIKGIELASETTAFKKMVLVNMPLMINFHKTLKYISQIPQTPIIAVYGKLDPSFPYLPFLEGKFENLKTITVPNADHNFEKMTPEFIGLSQLLTE